MHGIHTVATRICYPTEIFCVVHLRQVLTLDYLQPAPRAVVSTISLCGKVSMNRTGCEDMSRDQATKQWVFRGIFQCGKFFLVVEFLMWFPLIALLARFDDIVVQHTSDGLSVGNERFN